MGLCCCDMFDENQINISQSRLRLMESKVQAQYHTENDQLFTYYLHYYDQHAYLERVLRQFREIIEKTQDPSAYQFDNKQLQTQIDILAQYLKDMQTQQSQIYKKIKEDETKISQQAIAQHSSIARQYFCMVKLQIQGFEIVQGINKIAIIKTIQKLKQEKNTEQVIVLDRTKNEKIYRQLIFPTAKGSKIKITTEPFHSKVTIDVEDIIENQAVCNVFKFQNKNEDFGFIALRMQYFTISPRFHELRKERLFALQKQLKLCSLGPEGINRLSSRSNASSHINTIVSDQVSEYPNQYHM